MLIPITPKPTHMLPIDKIQNSLIKSEIKPAGNCNIDDAPIITVLIKPIWEYLRSKSSAIKGSKG